MIIKLKTICFIKHLNYSNKLIKPALKKRLPTMSRKPLMTQTAISESIRQEIQRFESVHPNIFNIHEIIKDFSSMQLQEQIREQLYAIEG